MGGVMQDSSSPSDEGAVALAIYPVIPYNFSRYAGVAQLIERFLAKEEVESLSLFTRTKIENPASPLDFLFW